MRRGVGEGRPFDSRFFPFFLYFRLFYFIYFFSEKRLTLGGPIWNQTAEPEREIHAVRRRRRRRHGEREVAAAVAFRAASD